ncbi:MAG: hypothetical protein JSR77_07510 [Planctomycetes bacterium]|nr:hypothetical protein [Planctomycetota bacterium]
MATARYAQRGFRHAAENAAVWMACCAALLLSACSFAREDSQPAGSSSFPIYWMGTTDDNEVRWRSGIKWSDRLTFGDAPVRHDSVAIYQQWIADDVRSQGISITTGPGYEATLRETMTRAFADRVPRADFSGYVLLDIEFIPLLWGKRTGGPDLFMEADHGPHQFDLWYTFVRESRPEVIRDLGTEAAERALADAYERAVRDWLTMMFRVARELRPQAKFCYYGMPMGSRHVNYNGPDPNTWRQRNDRCSWLIDLQDALMVPLYQDRFTVPDGQTPRGPYENTIAQSTDWIVSNMREAKRIAGAKPVLVLAWAKYMEFVTGHEKQFLSTINLDHMFRLPKQNGADGMVLWDHFDNQADYTAAQQFMDANVNGILVQLAGPPPGGGSGGGGSPPPPPPPPPPTPPEQPNDPTPPGGGGGGTPPTPPGGGDDGGTPPAGGSGSSGSEGESGGGTGGSTGGSGNPPSAPPTDPSPPPPPTSNAQRPAPNRKYGLTVRSSSNNRTTAATNRISRPGDPRNSVTPSRPAALRIRPKSPPAVRVVPTSNPGSGQSGGGNR